MEDEHVKRIQQAVDTLGEFYDCVQIFAITKTDEGYGHISDGSGDPFARYGVIKLWVKAFESEEIS